MTWRKFFSPPTGERDQSILDSARPERGDMGQIVLSHACTSRCLTQYYKFIMNAVDGAVGGMWGGALKAVGGLRCPLTPL